MIGLLLGPTVSRHSRHQTALTGSCGNKWRRRFTQGSDGRGQSPSDVPNLPFGRLATSGSENQVCLFIVMPPNARCPERRDPFQPRWLIAVSFADCNQCIARKSRWLSPKLKMVAEDRVSSARAGPSVKGPRLSLLGALSSSDGTILYCDGQRGILRLQHPAPL